MILDNDKFWEPSCESKYEYENDRFVFKIKKGEPGTCVGDDLPEYHPDGLIFYNFKERCEATSDDLAIGNYTWSSDIHIHAEHLAGNHNCFWQLHWHDGFEEPENYIKLTINDEGGFRIEPRDIPNTKATNSFNLRVEVEFRKADKNPYYLNVDFYIDNKYLASTRKLTDGKPYFKFGVYTLESKCDITHIFNNVKVEYQPYGAVHHIDQPLYLYKDENGTESYVTKSYIKEGEPVT